MSIRKIRMTTRAATRVTPRTPAVATTRVSMSGALSSCCSEPRSQLRSAGRVPDDHHQVPVVCFNVHCARVFWAICSRRVGARRNGVRWSVAMTSPNRTATMASDPTPIASNHWSSARQGRGLSSMGRPLRTSGNVLPGGGRRGTRQPGAAAAHLLYRLGQPSRRYTRLQLQLRFLATYGVPAARKASRSARGRRAGTRPRAIAAVKRVVSWICRK